MKKFQGDLEGGKRKNIDKILSGRRLPWVGRYYCCNIQANGNQRAKQRRASPGGEDICEHELISDLSLDTFHLYPWVCVSMKLTAESYHNSRQVYLNGNDKGVAAAFGPTHMYWGS
jgi:hypothetical protein